VGSARLSETDESGRPHDSGSATGRPQLGPAGCLAGEALGRYFAFVGYARIAFGSSRADMGLACGTRRAAR
jgi:hypothetical protein